MRRKNSPHIPYTKKLPKNALQEYSMGVRVVIIVIVLVTVIVIVIVSVVVIAIMIASTNAQAPNTPLRAWGHGGG